MRIVSRTTQATTHNTTQQPNNNNNNNNNNKAVPLDVGAGDSVARRVPTPVGDMAGEARRQPEPCTERCDEHYSLSRAGVVRHGSRIITFAFAVSSAAGTVGLLVVRLFWLLSGFRPRSRGRRGCQRVLRHVWTAGRAVEVAAVGVGWRGGAERAATSWCSSSVWTSL